MGVFTWKDEKIVEFLNKKIMTGSVILCSTDTVLGLLAGLNQTGFAHLNKLKQRFERPYLIIIGSFSDLYLFIKEEDINRWQPFLAAIWPGPVTIVFNTKPEAINKDIGIGPTIALRFPHHEQLAELSRQCKGLFSTSANISGQPVPLKIDDVDPSIRENVDAIVIENKKEEVFDATPSTIISLVGGFNIERAGKYNCDELENLYEEMIKE